MNVRGNYNQTGSRVSQKRARLTAFLDFMAETIQPNTTLYINNLNDKINKDEIRSQLFALFTTYGKLIDVVATKTPKMRGQAFLVFTDLASATAALRACDGMTFYDKPMVRIFIFILSCRLNCGRFVAHLICKNQVPCDFTP